MKISVCFEWCLIAHIIIFWNESIYSQYKLMWYVHGGTSTGKEWFHNTVQFTMYIALALWTQEYNKHPGVLCRVGRECYQDWKPQSITCSFIYRKQQVALFTSNNNHQLLALQALCIYLPDRTPHPSCLFGFPHIQLLHIVSAIGLFLV